MRVTKRQLLTLLGCVVLAPFAYALLYQFHAWYLAHPNPHVFALCGVVLLACLTYWLVTQGDNDGSFW